MIFLADTVYEKRFEFLTALCTDVKFREYGADISICIYLFWGA